MHELLGDVQADHHAARASRRSRGSRPSRPGGCHASSADGGRRAVGRRRVVAEQVLPKTDMSSSSPRAVVANITLPATMWFISARTSISGHGVGAS